MTSVNLEAVNQCGNTLKQEVKVTVQPDPVSVLTSSMEKLTSQYDGSRLILSSALPNPEGAETGHEWVEIRNREQRPTSLVGWTLAVGKTSIKKYPLSLSIEPLSRLRLYDSEMKFKLPNTESALTLLDPTGKEVSSVRWKIAEEGIAYYPDDIRDLDVSGRVLSVIDGDTFVLGLEGQARELLDTDFIHVRLLGIDAPEFLSSSPYSYESSEYLRALIENKRVDLTFDTDIWDRYGRLLAYISTEDSRDPARELLSMGLARVTRSFAYSAVEAYKDLELSAQKQKIGIWSLDTEELEVNIVSSSSSSSASSTRDEVPRLNLDTSSASVIISEIYASPLSNEKSNGALINKKNKTSVQIIDSINLSEWIELQSSDLVPTDLTGWKLAVNGKVKTLSNGLLWGSNRILVINLTELKLQLRNDGAIVSLLSPDGAEVSSVLYPALKNDYSYAYSSQDEDYCITTQPTPGDINVCRSPVPKVRASTLKKRAKISAYAQDLTTSTGEVLSMEDTEEPDGIPPRIFFLLSLLALSCIFLIVVRYRRV
jgi:micrococcal nuclease